MTTAAIVAIIAIAAVAGVSVVMGALSLRLSRTTSDFLVASRSVRPSMNAAAICGEYLSAGTFLGLGGLVMVFGVDMIWYPVGYTAGYLTLMFFVAAPLRRFGAYTIPEFAEGRFNSRPLRRLSAAFVLIIGWLYLMPQMKGAGLTIRTLTGAPFWVGVVLVGLIVTGNVAIGGMRGVTYVQALQYVIKIVAIAVPAIVLLGVTLGRGISVHQLFRPDPPVVRQPTTVTLAQNATLTTAISIGLDDGESVRTLVPGKHLVFAGQRVILAAGDEIPRLSRPKRADGAAWLTPFRTGQSGRSHPLYAAISLLIATFLGTMGLPHIVVRFYTNPDGPATRRTITVVLAMLAVYYIWPPVYGVLGRYWNADLLLTGGTDTVVLRLPSRILGGGAGQFLTGLVAAGAFAAFLSTAAGLLVSVAGALGYDLIRPAGVSVVTRFRISAVVAGFVAIGLGLSLRTFAINQLVGWAFAIAASSFCPLLILGIWWQRLTARGAAAGMVVGGGMAVVSVVFNLFGPPLSGWPAALVGQPAAWTVPLAFASAVGVSLLSPPLSSVLLGRSMRLLHTPERLSQHPDSAR